MIAPFGLFDEKDPATDVWAQRADDVPGLMCANEQIYKDLKAMPAGANSVEWPIEQTRASEAAARIFWPLGNTKLDRRLPLITAPTLLIWGEADRVIPRSYADKLANAISGDAKLTTIPGAGHLAELDQPDAVARRTSARRVAAREPVTSPSGLRARRMADREQYLRRAADDARLCARQAMRSGDDKIGPLLIDIVSQHPPRRVSTTTEWALRRSAPTSCASSWSATCRALARSAGLDIVNRLTWIG